MDAVRWPRAHGGRNQRGSASIWALLVTAGATTLLLGLVVDGGHAIDARRESSHVAAQAARAGADELSQASVRSGRDVVATGPASNRAGAYLRAAGMAGSVSIDGHRVTVTVTGRSDNEILGIIGIDSFPIHQTQTARAVTEETTP